MADDPCASVVATSAARNQQRSCCICASPRPRVCGQCSNSRNACATRKQCSCSKIAPGSTCALVELDCRGVKTTSANCKLEL
jgi:hypothetical protein